MLNRNETIEMLTRWKQYDSTTISHLHVIINDDTEDLVIERSKKMHIERGIISNKIKFKKFQHYMNLSIKRQFGNVYKSYKWNTLKNKSTEEICNILYRDIKIGKNKLRIKKINKDF